MRYFRVLGILFSTILLTLICCKTVIGGKINYDKVLDELNAYLTVNPSKSFELIKFLQKNVKQLSNEQHARLLILKSNKALSDGSYTKSEHLLQAAEKLTDSDVLLNTIYLHQATAAIALKDFQGALDIISKNLKRVKAIDSVPIKMTSYLKLTKLYFDLNAYQEANKYALLALDLSKGRSNKEHCTALLSIAEAQLKLNNYDKAKQKFNKSKQFCLQTGFPLMVAMANKGLGESYLNSRENYKAQKLLNIALRQYNHFQFKLGINRVHSLLAQTHLRLSKWRIARYYARLVMVLPNKSSNLEAKKVASKVLASLARRVGDYKQAYKYIVQYQRFNGQLHNDTKAKAYAYQMAKFENAKKTREIGMLNHYRGLYITQQKETELKLHNDSMILTIVTGASIFLVIFSVVMFVQRRKYKRISQLDQLTGVLNRGTGQDFAENLFINVLAQGDAFSVIMFDLDNFKRINDTQGHSAGDWTLKRVVAAIGSLLKNRDLFVRMGGEEFALFLPYVSTTEALALAEKCRQAIENIQTRPYYKQLAITASFGVCTNSSTDLSLDPLIKRVDVAVYVAKKTGRNRVVEYQPWMEIDDNKQQLDEQLKLD